MSRGRYILLAMLLGSLTMLGPLSVDIFTPTMERVAAGFNTDQASVAVSISFLFFGGAIGQLLYGPLADRYGRKPVILAPLAVYLFAIIGAVLAPTIGAFSLWRFLQGLAQASGRILAGAVARDLLAREQLGQMISAATFAGSVFTIGAPILGGVLAERFPWQSIFYVMAIVTVLMILSFIFLFEETLPPRRRQPLRLDIIIGNLAVLIRDKRYVSYVLCAALALCGLAAFVAVSASVLIGTFGLREQVFGLVFATVSVGFTVGTGFGGLFVTRMGLARMMEAGMVLMLIGGLAMPALAVMGIAAVWAVMAPMVIFVTGFSFLFPQAVAGALSYYPEMAGTASSLQGFTANIFGAVTAALLGSFGGGGQLSLALTVTAAAVSSSILYVFTVRRYARGG